MPTNPHLNLSSYLVQRPTARRQINWPGATRASARIIQSNPNLIARTLLALIVWSGLFASVNYLRSPHVLSTETLFNSGSTSSVAQRNQLNTTGNATLASAIPAKALADGPTGKLMPPGTMAPDGAYPNSYARGQCTWYVAGRRQIPSGWGNAASWYSHAASSGWNVGSIPAVAAIAWTPAGYYGHVALVEQVSSDGSQVQVSEMNYRGPYIKDLRWVSASAFKYIY